MRKAIILMAVFAVIVNGKVIECGDGAAHWKPRTDGMCYAADEPR